MFTNEKKDGIGFAEITKTYCKLVQDLRTGTLSLFGLGQCIPVSHHPVLGGDVLHHEIVE